jgi:UDP-N-acetylmuramyl pentapeptide phosphotransferase/UDP-N-acetylglucosamine-1-phosphate transferase
MMLYVLLILLFAFALEAYFKLALRYKIVDKPNARSSHSELTIRGGGIIYLLAGLTAGLLHSEFWIPILALLIIGAVSFLDDRMTLSNKIRIIFHLISVTLIFAFLGMFNLMQWQFLLGCYIIVIGIINAYNFMDGINGITGTYSLVVLGGLQFVNMYVTRFIEEDMIWLPIIASLVFLFYNFRKKAKCFAGDVGSITIALWIVFLLISLILNTKNYTYILFLAVYGVDSILTIIHRLILKQNIFNAHRLHLYQILANERKISHLVVSSIYAMLQLIIIVLVVCTQLGFLKLFSIVIIPLVLFYTLFKVKLMDDMK